VKPQGYFIVSLHREENVDSSPRLRSLQETLNALAARYDMPVIVSTHPRTRKRLEALEGARLDPRVQYMKPFGFHDYNHLQMNAFCAVSDSGTIAEESSILGFPAITPRDAIERPEALDVGCIVMTGLDRDTIENAVDAVTRLFAERRAKGLPNPVPADYCIENTSERVLSLILGTAKLSNGWDGIRMNDLT
jgi:UDP-N-acetyl-L-fucosamine synthase